jgi:intracellular sulfur oxidation DsrE/DsrF family protein
MNNHLKDILTALAKKGVRFVVCGGVAVALHGVERMTLDLLLI